MKFDEEYTKYWTSAVDKSIDGTKIASLNEVNYFLKDLNISDDNSILDLGCSYGRMSDVLSNYSNKIYGAEPDDYAVGEARNMKYADVKKGSAEKIPYDDNFFDLVFCWAVMDVVDHLQTFKEMNRVLKDNGKIFITGKNINYHHDDILAFKAEKNAYLKNFPNKFTNLDLVKKNINTLGFELIKLFIFPKRGDFGNLKFIDSDISLNNKIIGYEYLLVASKIDKPSTLDNKDDYLSSPVSFTANSMALENGLDSVDDYFKSIGID